MTLISVIIPNYNRETLLGETIQNMLDQSLPPHEVIVVDDGSTDRSLEVVRSFGSRVKLVQQRNQGPGAARNAGLAVAAGEFIQFMDSDDLASRNKLQVQAGALEREGADVAYGPWLKVRLADGKAVLEDHVLQQRALPPSRTSLAWLLSGWSTVLQTCLLRAELVRRIGPFRHDLLTHEDFEFMVRIFAESPRTVFSAGVITLYRLHAQSKLTESGASDLRRLQDRAAIYPQIADLLRQRGIGLGLAARVGFDFVAWQLWQEMRADGRFPQEKLDAVHRLWATLPSGIWRAGSLFRRLAIRLRFQLTGARWNRAYQSAFAGPAELGLIRDLGFECN